MDTKPYVEYLDKEMTIMGILSAVSIAAPAAILSTVLGDKTPLAAQFWEPGKYFIIAGSVSCVVAALLFYRQRSALAWFYGQICLAGLLEEGRNLNTTLKDWLREADSWETWRPYSWAFSCLVAGGLFNYGWALAFSLVAPRIPFFNIHDHVRSAKIALLCLTLATSLAISILQGYVLRRYRFAEDPWKMFRDAIRPPTRSLPPHHGVYTRLRPSSIHGVGVFAIANIARNTYIFEPDDDKLATVRADTIESLPSEVRRLYTDFAVLEDGTYSCPKNFNQLTLSWYLNSSKRPNVAADRDLKFYALKDIRAGDELTADYSTYSETPPNG